MKNPEPEIIAVLGGSIMTFRQIEEGLSDEDHIEVRRNVWNMLSKGMLEMPGTAIGKVQTKQQKGNQ